MSGSNPPGTYTITLVPPIQSITPGIMQQGYGPFAGMPAAMLSAALAQAQQAVIATVTGTKPVMVEYAEGQGRRQVAYTKTNVNDLYALIENLKAGLGMRTSR